LRTTDGIFQYVGRRRQKNLTRLIHENVIRRVHHYWKDRQQGIRMDDAGKLSVTWQVSSEKEDFVAWLEDRRVKFVDDKPPEEPEHPLFAAMDDHSPEPQPP
jgi:hypothetical protein